MQPDGDDLVFEERHLHHAVLAVDSSDDHRTHRHQQSPRVPSEPPPGSAPERNRRLAAAPEDQDQDSGVLAYLSRQLHR